MEDARMPGKVVVLLGPPGVGKGTQGVRLARSRGWDHVSTGDLLRAARDAGSELGRRAQACMERGELVPDDVIAGLVGERLESLPPSRGVVFDGFPRTVGQAETLDGTLADRGRQVDRVVLLEAGEELLVKRIAGRRSSPAGRVYNVYFDPPKRDGVCDETGEPLLHRADDRPETVRSRLAVYRETTAPLADFYERRGTLVRVSGEGEIGAIQEAVQGAVQAAVADQGAVQARTQAAAQVAAQERTRP